MKPHAPERFALHVTIGRAAYEDLQYAQALLGHAVPSGDIAQVVERALKTLVRALEKKKFAATDRPRPGRTSARPRHLPAAVKRAVWKRDRGQCAFVSESGRRCPERGRLEFDHVQPVARGGEATVENLRLACAAHNQAAAERAFGAGLMSEKRAARRAARAARERAAEAARAPAAEAARTRVADVAHTRAVNDAHSRAAAEAREPPRATGAAADVSARAEAAARGQARDIAGLRGLGFRADQSRRAAECCAGLPDATLEERMRAALRFLCPSSRPPAPVATTPAAPA